MADMNKPFVTESPAEKDPEQRYTAGLEALIAEAERWQSVRTGRDKALSWYGVLSILATAATLAGLPASNKHPLPVFCMLLLFSGISLLTLSVSVRSLYSVFRTRRAFSSAIAYVHDANTNYDASDPTCITLALNIINKSPDYSVRNRIARRIMPAFSQMVSCGQIDLLSNCLSSVVVVLRYACEPMEGFPEPDFTCCCLHLIRLSSYTPAIPVITKLSKCSTDQAVVDAAELCLAELQKIASNQSACKEFVRAANHTQSSDQLLRIQPELAQDDQPANQRSSRG